MTYVRLLLCSALFVLVACAGQITATRVPFQANYDASRQNELWQRALVVIQLRNYPISTVNEAAGLIVTDWAELGSVPCTISAFGTVATCRAREKLTLTLSQSGVLIVNINRQLWTNGSWSEPNQKQAVDDIHRSQVEVYRAIVPEVRTQAPVHAPATLVLPESLKARCEANDFSACSSLAEIVLASKDAANAELARSLLERACDGNVLGSCTTLGFELTLGTMLTKDYPLEQRSG